jgi:hypothetical protein
MSDAVTIPGYTAEEFNEFSSLLHTHLTNQQRFIDRHAAVIASMRKALADWRDPNSDMTNRDLIAKFEEILA